MLHHLSRGLSYAGVGAALRVSPNTVSSHVKSAYCKLDVHTAAAAVMCAVALRLIGHGN